MRSLVRQVVYPSPVQVQDVIVAYTQQHTPSITSSAGAAAALNAKPGSNCSTAQDFMTKVPASMRASHTQRHTQLQQQQQWSCNCLRIVHTARVHALSALLGAVCTWRMYHPLRQYAGSSIITHSDTVACSRL